MLGGKPLETASGKKDGLRKEENRIVTNGSSPERYVGLGLRCSPLSDPNWNKRVTQIKQGPINSAETI
jgi:hypothetical protein